VSEGLAEQFIPLDFAEADTVVHRALQVGVCFVGGGQGGGLLAARLLGRPVQPHILQAAAAGPHFTKMPLLVAGVYNFICCGPLHVDHEYTAASDPVVGHTYPWCDRLQ
jgi:hypothetical protein